MNKKSQNDDGLILGLIIINSSMLFIETTKKGHMKFEINNSLNSFKSCLKMWKIKRNVI